MLLCSSARSLFSIHLLLLLLLSNSQSLHSFFFAPKTSLSEFYCYARMFFFLFLFFLYSASRLYNGSASLRFRSVPYTVAPVIYLYTYGSLLCGSLFSILCPIVASQWPQKENIEETNSL